MVVRLRLARFGHRNWPTYRIVAADARSPRDGRCLEQVGSYDPHPNVAGIKDVTLKTDRIKYWLSVGAQPTERVARLLGQVGLLPIFAKFMPAPRPTVTPSPAKPAQSA